MPGNAAELELRTIEARIAAAMCAAELAAWRADVEGARASDDGARAALLAIAEDTEIRARLAAYAADTGAAADASRIDASRIDAYGARRAALLAARLERVSLGALGAREASLARRGLPVGPQAAARAAAWLECLRGDRARARREAAWHARVAAGPDATALAACFAARRRAPDYGARALAAHELDRAQVERLAADEAARTEATWRAASAARAAALGVARLAPWDLFAWPGAATTRDELRAALARTGARAALERDLVQLGFASAGRTRVDEPLGGAEVGATTYFVEPPHDVRVVAADAGGELGGWQRLAHELGHALYARGHDATLPWSLRDAPAPWLHEAVAQAFALRPARAAWMVSCARLSTAQAEELAAHAAFERLLEARLRLVHVGFERDLHDPATSAASAGELSARWWAGMERLVGVSHPAHPPSWARVAHFTTRPGSAAAYLAADVAAAQLEPAIEAAGPRAASWLDERLFRPGATRAASVTLRALLDAPAGARPDAS